MKLAWIGLGAMGRPMAANLAARFDTLVHNRTSAVADEHAAAHGTTPVDLTDVAAADVIFTCLPTTSEVITTAETLLAELRPGTTWVDCTSGDPAASRDLAARLADIEVTYLDAPVSGGTDGAAAGTLTIMVGGDQDALERVRPALEVLGTNIVHVGPVGAGHAVKAVNNTLLAANLWMAAEGLAALARIGVDPGAALQVINGSSGRSYTTERLLPERVLTREFPPTFALGLLAKDAGIGQDVIDEAAIPAPMLRQIIALYHLAARELGPDVDHSEAVRLVERWSEVTLSG
jgi:3-hydroxyisobutyrate dehydrogenase